MEISKLYENINYKTDLSLVSCPIYEYDMRKANISVLLEKNVISEDLYTKLYNGDRLYRQIYIGNMIKNNPVIGVLLKTGIKDAKKRLFETYNIQDNEVIGIKNDAVFLTKYLGEEVNFSPIVFIKKNKFTLYCRIFRIELFFLLQSMSDDILIVKGIGEEKYKYHKDFMFDFIKVLFREYQTNGPKETIMLLRTFYYNYINRLLDVGYYRGMDSDMYDVVTSSELYQYHIKNIEDSNMIKMLNINTNAAILRELSRIFYIEYFRTLR